MVRRLRLPVPPRPVKVAVEEIAEVRLHRLRAAVAHSKAAVNNRPLPR